MAKTLYFSHANILNFKLIYVMLHKIPRAVYYAQKQSTITKQYTTCHVAVFTSIESFPYKIRAKKQGGKLEKKPSVCAGLYTKLLNRYKAHKNQIATANPGGVSSARKGLSESQCSD